jgi:hypothetical protein
VSFAVVVLPSSTLRRRWAPRHHLLLLSVTNICSGESQG